MTQHTLRTLVRQTALAFTTALLALATLAPGGAAQFDEVPVPESMARLDFMLGEWTVTGTFRTPDHIGGDRTLWYETRGGGLTRFDGQGWTAFSPGSPTADSVRGAMGPPADPFAFAGEMSVTRIQDDFMLLIDEGRTSGSTLIYFDGTTAEWVATAFHAPTNGVTRSAAAATEGLPVFEGRATDRRGERIFRTRYEVHGPDHFTIHIDVSFDDGVTWLDDQSVREARRKAQGSPSPE